MAAKKRVGLMDIQRRFVTEDACRDYLFNQRWRKDLDVPSVDAESIITLRRVINTRVKTADIRHL